VGRIAFIRIPATRRRTALSDQLEESREDAALAPPAFRNSVCDPSAPAIAWLPGLEPEFERNAKPFLRWAGGKTRLLRTLLPHFPKSFRSYHEPFLGGGSVFFAIRRRANGTCYLSDLNTELIKTWRVVRSAPEKFLSAIELYRGRNSEAEYYKIRSERPDDDIASAARFFYLNQTAWNGLWRVNRWGVFNVPWGARKFRGISPRELSAVSAALRETEINELDFREALKRPRRGDFVYLDPPYLPVSDTSKFAGYTEKRFRLASLGDLATACQNLSRRGVFWVLSNRDTAAVRELFHFGRIVALTTHRSVAAQNRRNVQPKASPEVIIIGENWKR
jgi:DNA adenine methylase